MHSARKYLRRPLFIIMFAGLLMHLLMPAAASGAPFPGDWKIRQAAVIEKLLRGEPQDLIVVFDQSAAGERARYLRAFSGADHDTLDILREKALIFRNTKQAALNMLTTDDAETITDYSHLPMMFLRVKSQKGLERLAAQPGVLGMYENQKFDLLLNQSLPLIGQPEVAAAGFAGAGTSVAVLDSGVDYTRSAFNDCTGVNTPGECCDPETNPGCTNPLPHDVCRVACVHDFAADDGVLDDLRPYPYPEGHGTNVSGIVSGVAPDAKVIGLDVLTNDSAFFSDIASAINWVIDNKDAYNIVAINMSLGIQGQKFSAPCPSTIYKLELAIDSAKQAGIVVVIASGNDGYIDGISYPACVPSAVSVGAVYDGGPYSSAPTGPADTVTYFSNSAPFLTILAPGADIRAAGITMRGTSQAAPHISGSVAVLRSLFPAETPDQTVSRMVATGVQVLDTRNNLATSRIDLEAAVNGSAAAYVITGKVVLQDGLPVENVTIDLSGDAARTTTTDAEGFYRFTGVPDGSYTITPFYENAVFSPSFALVTVSGGSRNLPNFTMRILSIRGNVRTASGQPVPGVTVTIGGEGSGSAVTDSNGKYVLSGLGNGIYTVTPEKPGYSFIPPSKTITVSDRDKKGKNFTAVTYAIKGYVRNASGYPVQGATVSLTGAVTKTKKTDANGFYRFGNLPEGDYVVTPSKGSKIFEPASTDVTISGASVKLKKFSVSP